LYFLTAGSNSVASTAHRAPLFKKGQWVIYARSGQAMRVQRDQKADGPDTYMVWCEWTDGGYHLETHDELEVNIMPQTDWPADAGLLEMDDTGVRADALAPAPGDFNA